MSLSVGNNPNGMEYISPENNERSAPVRMAETSKGESRQSVKESSSSSPSPYSMMSTGSINDIPDSNQVMEDKYDQLMRTEIEGIVNDPEVKAQLDQIDQDSTLSQEVKTEKKIQVVENEINTRIQEWQNGENSSISQLVLMSAQSQDPSKTKEMIQNILNGGNTMDEINKTLQGFKDAANNIQ